MKVRKTEHKVRIRGNSNKTAKQEQPSGIKTANARTTPAPHSSPMPLKVRDTGP